MSIQLLSHSNGITKKILKNGHPVDSITEAIPNGFFSVDRQWTVKSWNKAAEVILGVKSKDILGKNLWEKFAGIIPVKFYAVYQYAFLGDIPVHFEEYWDEMGAWFNVTTYYSDNTLSVSFSRNNHMIVPEQSAKQLRMLNELYRFVTEITNDCLWEWDLKAREIFWIDGGHKRVFGYPVENAIIPQRFWENRLHPEDKPRVLKKLNKTIAKGTDAIWEDEYRFQKSDGDYAYVCDRGHIIYEGGKKASRMIGATQDITDRVMLENKLAQVRQARQREITEAVLTAQEKERAAIGEELHDNLNQILAVAKLYMQMAITDDEKKEMYLEKSSGFIEEVIVEIRRISKTLVIPGTHIIGLFDNIKNLLHDLVIIHPIKIEFRKKGIDEADMDEKLQKTIFRIFQEQLNNILKHAKATRATIDLSREKDQVVLLITDNGKGCDPLKDTTGLGIINIKSRVELFHGIVRIVSRPGAGYELEVTIPLNYAALNLIK